MQRFGKLFWPVFLLTGPLQTLASRACGMCRVTIFVVATENAGKGCQITPTKGSLPEVIAYEKRVCAYLFTPFSCPRAHSKPALLHLEHVTLDALTQNADTLWSPCSWRRSSLSPRVQRLSLT